MKIEIIDGKIIIDGLDSDKVEMKSAEADKNTLSFSVKSHIMKEIKQIAKKNEQPLGKIARSFFLMGLTFYRERKTALEKPKGLYLVEEKEKAK